MVRVCSDCESALDLCVGDSEPSSQEAHRILESIRRISLRFRVVEFQWVRAHANNRYNELADSVAYQIAHRLVLLICILWGLTMVITGAPELPKEELVPSVDFYWYATLEDFDEEGNLSLEITSEDFAIDGFPRIKPQQKYF